MSVQQVPSLSLSHSPVNSSFFEIDGPWWDFTAVTKLIKRSTSVHVLGDDYNNEVLCNEQVLNK